MPKIILHNAETGEIIEREMNAEELLQHNKDIDNAQTKSKEAVAKLSAKSALLTKLGITEDEARLLLS